MTDDVCDFVESLIQKLEALKTLDFIYRQQETYFSNETCIAVGDF